MKQLTLEQVKQKAKKYMKNHELRKAYNIIKTYLSNPLNNMDKELLKTYMEIQIKLGLFNEATNTLKYIILNYPEVYQNNPFALALKYASCNQIELLKRMLKTNTFTDQERYQIARTCYKNAIYDIAKNLFSTLTSSEDISIKESSTKYLNRLIIHEENTDKVFLPKRYNSFKYYGNKLQKGHVITVKKIRYDYPENKGMNKRRETCQYMIWKIEGELIYAFPITTTILKDQYLISKDNYPIKEQDRYIEPNLFCLNEEDVTNVIDLIKDDDYEQSINTMYLNMCSNRLTSWPNEIEYFMNALTTSREIIPGSIIIVSGEQIHYYYVSRIDNYNQKYQVFEVNEYFLPISKKIIPIYIDINTPIKAVIYQDNNQAKSNNPLTKRRVKETC